MTMRLSTISLAGDRAHRGGRRDLERGLHVRDDARGRAAQLLHVVRGLGLVGASDAGALGDLRVRGGRRLGGRDRRRRRRRLHERGRGLGGRRSRRGGRGRAGAAGSRVRRREVRRAGRGRRSPVARPVPRRSRAPGPSRWWRPRRACSPRRSPTTPGRPSSCPSGTARTARPRATRWHRKRHASSQDPPSGSRWDRPLPLRFVTAPLLVRLLLLLMTTLRPAARSGPASGRPFGTDPQRVFTWSAHAGQHGATCQFARPSRRGCRHPSRSWLCWCADAPRAQVMSRRKVVTRPIAARPTPYASSTRAPCHHSSSDPTPVSA